MPYIKTFQEDGTEITNEVLDDWDRAYTYADNVGAARMIRSLIYEVKALRTKYEPKTDRQTRGWAHQPPIAPIVGNPERGNRLTYSPEDIRFTREAVRLFRQDAANGKAEDQRVMLADKTQPDAPALHGVIRRITKRGRCAEVHWDNGTRGYISVQKLVPSDKPEFTMEDIAQSYEV